MQTDFKPNWKALEKKIGDRCQEFMYMGRVGGINLYKHILTRRYLNLDDLGNCYIYRNSRYELTHFELQMALIKAGRKMISRTI